MNNFVNALKKETNYTHTTNGALVHASTLNKVFDMFARVGAMRQANDWDCINLFKEAYEENAEFALKCLFWSRDVRGGAGERRYFRICYNWLAKNDPDAVIRNLEYVPFVGRYDDLYCLVGTPVESAMWDFIKKTIANDMKIIMEDKTGKRAISLLGKWLPSQNTSSKETIKLGKKTAAALSMTARQYRKTLSALRKRINVLETLMSANRWEEIDFSGIPSKAGLLYREAFQKHQPERYEEFITNKETKVNAATLYPYDIVGEVIKLDRDSWDWWSGTSKEFDPIQRETLNKYWANQVDYFNGKELDALCVIDTSGSMCTGLGKSAPINVAVSLGLYCAERAQGPFHNHYISFSRKPQLIETSGVDFVDKVQRIYRTNLCEDTNIEATFDLILKTIVDNNVSTEDAPKRLIIISDMQFNDARGYGYNSSDDVTLMEHIRSKWETTTNVPFPSLIYWNVNAENPTFPSLGENISYVSGCSPVLFDAILSNKNGVAMMLDVLGKDRYKKIK